MIDWSQNPEAPKGHTRWKVIRVPRHGRIQGVIISTAHRGVYTHYFSKRTQPCRGENCEACEHGARREWHAYIAVWSPQSQATNLLELTARAATAIVAHVAAGDSLRGVAFRAIRCGGAENAPVEVTLLTDSTTHLALPPEPDITACLLVTWRLDQDPTARDNAPPASFVRGHRRKRSSLNGDGPPQPVLRDGPAPTGRSRRADGLHLEAGQNGNLPSSPADQAALD